MINLDMWHVLRDPESGERSCHYYIKGAMKLQEDGTVKEASAEKEEVPFCEWTDQEICDVLTRHLGYSGMGRLKPLPGIVLRAMENCGVDEGTRTEVMRKIMECMPGR